MEKFRALPVAAEDEADVALLDHAVTAARARPSIELWVKAGDATGAIEEHVIKRSQRWETMDHAHRRAKRLLLIGGALVALFGAASAFVFVRWQREQREAL